MGTVGSSQVGDWTDRIIRCNPAYRLVDICDLSDVERALLPSSPTGGAPAALLLPRDGSALGTKAICSDTRSLLVRADGTRSTRHLLESCRDGTTSDDIATLVMDRILEVETGGVFASGALAQVGLALSDDAGERTGLARKSREALRSASHLDDRNEPGLAAFLYSFGRYPVTPSWRRRLPDVARTRAFLGLDDSPVEALLRRRWDPAAGGRVTDGWFAWRRHNTERRGSAVHKLYVSPSTSTLPWVLPTIVSALSTVSATHFKIGADLGGLLRPDKMVAYFPSRGLLDEAAASIADLLPGQCEPHGVPFTAQVRSDCTVSWGMDPLPGDPVAMAGHSWRSWVCTLAARALVAAREDSMQDHVEFALARLRLEGVDTTTWEPDDPDRAGQREAT